MDVRETKEVCGLPTTPGCHVLLIGWLSLLSPWLLKPYVDCQVVCIADVFSHGCPFRSLSIDGNHSRRLSPRAS
eukprot:scaffold135421_cov17-Prasinocladus_malaysianus.AAC.1